MSQKQSTADSEPRRRLSILLTVVFSLSMIMGTGPGVLLVNRADTVAGVPLVYAWGILWYLVQVAVALVAYFVVWDSSSSAGKYDGGSSLKSGRTDRS